MSQSVAAKRYALALFELAEEQGQTSSILAELREIKQAFLDNQELEQLLDNPQLTMDKKKELLKNLFNSANPFILNTLYVLLERKRMNEIVNLVNEFIEFANNAAGIAEAKVYSTRALSEEESNSISAAFAQKVGKQSLRIENIIDPNLLGGVRLQIGNRIYDSSVSAKLERLKRDLIGS